MIRIGLIGTNGAGKSTACAYFKEKGFEVFSLSNIIRQECDRLGLEKTRENLITTGNRLKKEGGQAILAQKAIEFAEKNNISKIVFDSIRNDEECRTLKKNSTLLIGIDAPIEIRYKRVKLRNDSTDHVDFETFRYLEGLEMSGQSSGQYIARALEHCQTIISNDKDETHLHDALSRILETSCQD
jgi:dephospho-CoA kinase